MQNSLKVFFVGDIIGRPGRRIVRELLPYLIDSYSVDMVIANGENAAGGNGLTYNIAEELVDFGIDVITSGNHIWDKKEMVTCIERIPRLLRPANYPPRVPGKGSGIFETSSGLKVGVVNLEGRVFMKNIDCPFRKAEEIIRGLREETSIIMVDFHAEATSEKVAMGWFLDGKVSAVIGTHTHIQTADEKVLPRGTAFITDAGMTGSLDSVIGVKAGKVLERFLTQMPQKFEVADKNLQIQGLLVTIDTKEGKALDIERVKTSVKGR
ncbi:MAG: TIGR00282 family metallophosphoesterase [Thermodesulfobacteriota bacterium]